jgi:nudix-type nucleoside diphosphatase (YffH/AdpP family)
MAAPHDTPAGENPNIRNMTVETICQAHYALHQATFEQRQLDGVWRRIVREAYDRGNGAAALLRHAERDTVLLVRQYRLPAHLNDHPDGMLLEVPAGLLDDGEDAEDALRRELQEEVGHTVGALQRLFQLYMSPGSVTEHLTFFVGEYTDETRTGEGGGEASEGEDLEILEVPFGEAQAMVADGRICDAKTVILLEWAAAQT